MNDRRKSDDIRKVWIIKGPSDLELTPYRPIGIPAHSVEMTEEGWQNYRKTRDDYFSWERWIWDRLNDKGEEK